MASTEEGDGEVVETVSEGGKSEVEEGSGKNVLVIEEEGGGEDSEAALVVGEEGEREVTLEVVTSSAVDVPEEGEEEDVSEVGSGSRVVRRLVDVS